MVKRTSHRRNLCLTVTKLSSLQRFILKAAYCNRLYQKKLSRSEDGPWRDLMNNEVAMLFFNVGAYAGPSSKSKIFGVTIPATSPFNRHVRRGRDAPPKKVRDKMNASITRAMKRLEDRELIERVTQNHKDIFIAGCNLTIRGYKMAADLVAIALGNARISRGSS
jgi:hypothetical protein